MDAPQRDSDESLTLRCPSAGDALGIWHLVRGTPALDENSAYAYLLLCSDFAEDGIVATRATRIRGFVLGFRPPREPSVLFVWQICVSADERGNGLGQRMLRELLRRRARAGVRTLTATVTPDNAASRALFLGLARDLAAPVAESVRFAARLLPAPHGEERELRIGPIDPHRLAAPAVQETIR